MLEIIHSGDSSLGGVLRSRWAYGGGVENWPLARRLISRGGSLHARLMLGVTVKDATPGSRVYPTSIVSGQALGRLESRGDCFQIDMTRRILASGFPVVEVSIEFHETRTRTWRIQDEHDHRRGDDDEGDHLGSPAVAPRPAR